MNNEQDKLDRLQELSETLPFQTAGFDSDDVRVRLGRARAPRVARWGIAAAAVLALVLTHAGAYRLGSRTTPGVDVAAPPDPLATSERILTRAAELDPGAPAHVLNDELGALRSEILTAALPQRLNAVGDRRATRFADALTQFDELFELVRDPGLRAMMAVRIARVSLDGQASFRFLPGSANTFAQVVPTNGGNFRVIVIDSSRDRVLVEDEGTVDDLRKRHPAIRFVSGD